MRFLAALLLTVAALPAAAQDCKPIDLEAQKAEERACQAAGGKWSRFGVRDHLCGIYSCAPRTADGGQVCRNHSDCDYLCVYSRQAPVGTPVTGECAAYRSSFGCVTHVNGGVIAGRVCLD